MIHYYVVMKNHLSAHIYQFIDKYQLEGQKIVIAVSTGLDSMVLLDLILKLKQRFQLTVAVAHVHHGWRAQSDTEYEFLETFCQNQDLIFFGKKLDLSSHAQDAENIARKARYAFFQEVYTNFNAVGLFLAHHAGDLEETVVKRIFEGSFIAHLGAMGEKGHFLDMITFRPLLEEKKESLKLYAQTHGLCFFEDETNHDPKFLRARLRKDYFPMLKTVFGKNSGSNLLKLAEQSALMKDFFEKRYEKEVYTAPFQGSNQVFYLQNKSHLFEIMNFIMVFFKKKNITLPYSMIKAVSESIERSIHPKKFILKNFEIYASKGFMVLFDQNSRNEESLKDEDELCIKKLPDWFYKKILALKTKNKNILNI